MEGIIRALNRDLLNGDNGIFGIDSKIGIDIKFMVCYGKLFEVVKLTGIFDLLDVTASLKCKGLQ